MKAVIKNKPQFGAELVDVPIPTIERDQVLVKIRATSICGTDVHIYEWNSWAASRIGEKALPQILGHEVAGEVVKVGESVRGIKIGDYVSAETHIPAPQELQTMVGQMHLGERMKILGVDCNGAFAEYVAIPESVCWINDTSILPEIATVQEPIGNSTYAVLGEDNDVAGKTMAIIGDGPTALFAVGIARLCGVTTIFLIGMSESNMEIGRRMGADHLLFIQDKKTDRVKYIKDRTRGYGVDIVLDMVGASDAIMDGFKYLRKGGRFSAFGLASAPVTLDYNNAIVFKGIHLFGINGRKMFDTWYRVRNFLSSGRLDVTPVITHKLRLEEFAKGFKLLMDIPRVAAKVILFPDEKEYQDALKRDLSVKKTGSDAHA